LPARIARKGSTRLLVPLGHPASLDDIQPNFATLLSLGAELGTEGFFVFAMDLGAARPSTDSRMFCPAIGIPEDPVSGNAHAMLAAYLWDADRRLFIADGFTGRQGRQVQRPGYVEVTLEIEHDQLRAVSIGGKAVIVSDGLLV
jgi:PhzF family phenazine biosynthesis protein